MINKPYLENRISMSNLRRKILVEVEKNFYEENQSTNFFCCCFNVQLQLKLDFKSINKGNKSVCVDHQCISHIKVCCSHEIVQG